MTVYIAAKWIEPNDLSWTHNAGDVIDYSFRRNCFILPSWRANTLRNTVFWLRIVLVDRSFRDSDINQSPPRVNNQRWLRPLGWYYASEQIDPRTCRAMTHRIRMWMASERLWGTRHGEVFPERQADRVHRCGKLSPSPQAIRMVAPATRRMQWENNELTKLAAVFITRREVYAVQSLRHLSVLADRCWCSKVYHTHWRKNMVRHEK